MLVANEGAARARYCRIRSPAQSLSRDRYRNVLVELFLHGQKYVVDLDWPCQDGQIPLNVATERVGVDPVWSAD